MLKKFLLVAMIGLSSCSLLPSKENDIVGKWVLVEPVKISYLTFANMEFDFTENGNIFNRVTTEIYGKKNVIETNGKYEIDGERILWHVGGNKINNTFTFSKEGYLISEYRDLTNSRLIYTVRLKRFIK